MLKIGIILGSTRPGRNRQSTRARIVAGAKDARMVGVLLDFRTV